MDPIGFGLENFDWMGRWRDKEANGQPVDASGTMPSGEKFSGPVELRQSLQRQGIVVETRSVASLPEESPGAYKDVDEVARACEGAGLSRPVARLRPVGVLKG